LDLVGNIQAQLLKRRIGIETGGTEMFVMREEIITVLEIIKVIVLLTMRKPDGIKMTLLEGMVDIALETIIRMTQRN
jgi:hypothetical protein